MDVNQRTHHVLTARLQLLQLADSALPIGALSHSFGIESLAAEGGLDVSGLPRFFAEWLDGAGHIEAVFCVRAVILASQAGDGGSENDFESQWRQLNELASAMRPARESREASLRLGRRFLSLAAMLEPDPRLRRRGDVHLCTAFGLVGAVLGLSAAEIAAAALHQAVFGAVSVCQRLLPLGQSFAMQLLWQMKSQMAAVIDAACAHPDLDTLWMLQPRLEIASMRHPALHTRLFIS